jgi:hypothetical protein
MARLHLAVRRFAMYRVPVEHATRDDIAAAAAAHRELGPDYDSALAESLVDRIGAEIDKRIDSRLGAPRSDSRSAVRFSSSGRTPAVGRAARDDIAAAAAAHRELGPEYDGAVAESLVDRIGAEIDKRIDSRLAPPQSDSRSAVKFSSSGRTQAWIGAGAGAGITGLVAMIANMANTGSNRGAVVVAVVWIWVILAIATAGAAVVRRYRSR